MLTGPSRHGVVVRVLAYCLELDVQGSNTHN